MKITNLCQSVAQACIRITVLGCFASLFAFAPAHAQTPKNIIIMFADGVAATQLEFGRYSSELLRGQPFSVTADVMRQGVMGLMSTLSNNAYVTDSAAAASAMSTGFKANNGAISTTPQGAAPATLMQDARKQGKKIGVVTTSMLYDASPAAFSVNAKSRRDYEFIVNQYLTLAPEVMLGGGADYFKPDGMDGGKRKDAQDVVEAFRKQGYSIARKTADLAQPLNQRNPKLLGLFADDAMGFAIDRDPTKQPSLADMTASALKVLSAAPDKGFVLFVENENTDTAGHDNDVGALMHELWAFDDAVKVALAFRKRHPDTLVIVTGDHETGGFSPTSAQRAKGSRASGHSLVVNADTLRVIGEFKMSFQEISDRMDAKAKEGADRDTVMAYLADLIQHNLPGMQMDEEVRALILNKQAPSLNIRHHHEPPTPAPALGLMVARQTGLYWGSSGHTSEPATVSAIGPGAALFRGYQDNTDFARNLRRLLGVQKLGPKTKP
jgi:alkaline phosphatase